MLFGVVRLGVSLAAAFGVFFGAIQVQIHMTTKWVMVEPPAHTSYRGSPFLSQGTAAGTATMEQETL